MKIIYRVLAISEFVGAKKILAHFYIKKPFLSADKDTTCLCQGYGTCLTELGPLLYIIFVFSAAVAIFVIQLKLISSLDMGTSED